MFVVIEDIRIRLSTIEEYEPKNSIADSTKCYLCIVIRGVTRNIYFNNREQLDIAIDNLDKILKVQTV